MLRAPSTRSVLFVWLLYPLVLLKSASWGFSAVLLLVSALTVANPGTDDGPIFYSLIVVIVTSSISDILDQRICVVTSNKFRPDVFWFKVSVAWVCCALC